MKDDGIYHASDTTTSSRESCSCSDAGAEILLENGHGRYKEKAGADAYGHCLSENDLGVGGA